MEKVSVLRSNSQKLQIKYTFQIRCVQTPCIGAHAGVDYQWRTRHFSNDELDPTCLTRSTRRFRETPNDAHDSVHAISGYRTVASIVLIYRLETKALQDDRNKRDAGH